MCIVLRVKESVWSGVWNDYKLKRSHAPQVGTVATRDPKFHLLVRPNFNWLLRQCQCSQHCFSINTRFWRDSWGRGSHGVFFHYIIYWRYLWCTALDSYCMYIIRASWSCTPFTDIFYWHLLQQTYLQYILHSPVSSSAAPISFTLGSDIIW